MALIVMNQASASRLSLAGGPRPFTTSLERCDDTVAATTLPTSGTSASVEVSGVAAACAGASLGVTVYDPSTWATSTGCVVTNSAGNVVNGKACSLVFGRNTAASGTSWNAKVTVTTTETKPVSWRATVDFADLTRFPFRARYVGEYTGGAVFGSLASGFCSGTGRVVTFTGNAGYGWDTVAAGSSRTVDLVGGNAGATANPMYSCP